MIEPRTLKGFRDHLPAQALARERVLEIARRVYRSYGFAPIDTPALEYLEILTGKGSDETDKQLYRFQDHGGRDVGLRFDLTVPFARFAAKVWFGYAGDFPVINSELTMQILMGMLGLGAMRSVEKVKGSEGNR